MLHKDSDRLNRFLRRLPKKHRYAVEFRHPSWLDEEIFDVLRANRAAFVSVSSMAMPMNLIATTDFIYIRFHGLHGGSAHDYTAAELRPWAAHCHKCLARGLDVYAYFNNDVNTRAPENAKQLIAMIQRKGSALEYEQAAAA